VCSSRPALFCSAFSSSKLPSLAEMTRRIIGNGPNGHRLRVTRPWHCHLYPGGRGRLVLGQDCGMESFRTETSVGIAAVQRALAIAGSGIGEVHFKEGRDVVTDADVAIEDEIRAFLGESFGITVVGEERGGVNEADAPYWLVDRYAAPATSRPGSRCSP